MVTRHSGQANAVRSSFVPVKSMEVEDSKTSSCKSGNSRVTENVFAADQPGVTVYDM